MLVNAINAVADETGVVASLDEDNRLNLTADDGRNIGHRERKRDPNGTRCSSTTVTGGRITLKSEEQVVLDGNAIDKLGDVGGAGATLFGVNDKNSSRRLTSPAAWRERTIEIADVAINRCLVSEVTSVRFKTAWSQRSITSL